MLRAELETAETQERDIIARHKAEMEKARVLNTALRDENCELAETVDRCALISPLFFYTSKDNIIVRCFLYFFLVCNQPSSVCRILTKVIFG